jgi:dienelactone hydrolase
MMKLAKVAVFTTAFLIGYAVACPAARSQSGGTIVELETPLASSHPLQGYLRHPNGTGPSPAVVLLHSCSGNWRHVDERWGKRIASWGYAALSVDSFGPRGIKTTCRDNSISTDFASDAYRALDFLAQQPSVDPARVAAVGFAMGGFFVLSSVERGIAEQASSNKFRAAVAFYPPCGGLKGDLTVPTLILIGERDDLNSAEECRNLVAGRDGWGISRQKDRAIPIKLVVYPDAYHAFDAPGLKTPREILGHHLEFNQTAADQAAVALHEFLDATIGGKVPGQ